MSPALIAAIVAGVVVLAIIFIYNGLVNRRNQARNAYSQIDVQLKRRNDLIPNLVETVKGYMKHEKSVLENITKARSAVLAAESPGAKSRASNMLSETLKSLFAVSENYPRLKANENFLQLQEEIAGTESKIAYARQHYNDVVTSYNNSLETVPTSIFGSLFNFRKEELFAASEAERKNVKVEF